MDERLIKHPLGFWQVRDMPTGSELEKYYREKYFQESQSNYRSTYAAEEREWIDCRIERVAAAVARVRGSVAGTLLDVGCGEGFALEWFSRRGWAVKGIDYSRAGVEGHNPNQLPRLEIGDIPEILDSHAVAGRRYDLVWLTNVLEHVADPPGLLRGLRRLVSDRGVCVVTVPNDGSLWQETLRERGVIDRRFWIAIPDHLAYFDRDSLRSTVTALGWQVETMLAEFPIDWFIADPDSNYVADRSKGAGAHRARILVDSVLSKRPVEDVNAFYSAMAAVGMGRQLTVVLS